MTEAGVDCLGDDHLCPSQASSARAKLPPALLRHLWGDLVEGVELLFRRAIAALGFPLLTFLLKLLSLGSELSFLLRCQDTEDL